MGQVGAIINKITEKSIDRRINCSFTWVKFQDVVSLEGLC
jgi:hypothetical protein